MEVRCTGLPRAYWTALTGTSPRDRLTALDGVGGAGGLPIFGQGEPICHPLVSCVHCRQECCPLLKPMQMMFDRAENEKSESDVAYFHGLMYAGEMMMKLAVAGLVAAVQDDRERNRYRLEYQLVRADSLGAWDKVLDNILAGPSAQFLDSEATTTTRALTERMAEGTWQASSLQGLSESIQRVGLGTDHRSALKRSKVVPGLRTSSTSGTALGAMARRRPPP